MTIFNATWLRDYNVLLQRLAAAHVDLTRIAAALRDSATTEVWTESPSDASKYILPNRYSAEGWRAHYASERTWMANLNTAHGSDIQTRDPQAYVAMQGYLTSIANLAAPLAAAISGHMVGGQIISEKLTQAERDALATAIEAELQ